MPGPLHTLVTSGLAAAALALGLATAASADTSETGVVDLTGSVPPFCTVITGGAANSFGSTVSLGTLSDSNGHLAAGLQGATNAFSPQTFQVNCTGAGNAISLAATPLTTGAGTAPAGYAATVNYAATVTFALAGSGSASITGTTPLPVATTSLASAQRLANQTGNVAISFDDFATAHTTTDILVAGGYTATITVTIGVGT